MDKPIWLRRTARELLLLGIGALFVARELSIANTDYGNLAVYALATLLFALRFFPARAVGVGVALAALAQRWPPTLYQRQLVDIDWSAYMPLIVLPLLASRDLRQRFDRAPSRFANPWTTLPERDARALRWSAYAAGALAGVLWQIWWRGSDHAMLWPPAAMVALSLCVVLLAFGRAAALLAIPLLAGAIIVALTRSNAAVLFFWQPEYYPVAVTLAAIAALIAAPYTWKLLRRARA